MKLLIAYPFFPEADRNAGCLRLWEMLQILRAQGHDLTFLARHANDERYRSDLARCGVVCATEAEVNPDRSETTYRQWFRDRDFDAAILMHYENYRRYAHLLRAFAPRCRIILDTVDLHFVRVARQAALEGTPEAAEHAERVKREELEAVATADATWVVTAAERDTLRDELPNVRSPICVLPTIHRAERELSGHAERDGIIFIGSYKHPPNVDAVTFFLDEMLPSVRRRLPSVPVTLAGSDPPAALVERGSQLGVAVPGYVRDHRALLRAHRVGIAPLRYGAGMKGKIGDYLSCGLPCVTTSVGSEGMGLADGQNILVADDPASFAAAICRLNADVDLWNRLARSGCDSIASRFSPEAVGPLLREALKNSVESAGGRPASWRSVVRLLSHPGNVTNNAGKVWRALRRGGVSELITQWKLWKNQPASSPAR